MATTAAWATGAALVMLAWVLVLFPVGLVALARLRPRPVRAHGEPRPVTIVLAAHREQAVIGERIRNLLDQDYPPALVHVVVAIDGCPETREAAAALASDRVQVLDLPRLGKAGALNAALARVRGEIVAFTDANARWEPGTLRALVAPFADPTVGGTAGDQRYTRTEEVDPVAVGEMTYWDFDRVLKRAQSLLGSVTSATGAVYALRRELVEPVPPDVTDDFFLSTGAVAAGTRLVFVPTARSWEPVAPDREAEFARKVRVMTRGLRGLRARAELLDPRRHGLYAVQLLTHKLLRRLLFVPMVVLAAGSLIGWSAHAPLRVLAIGQAGFYGAAALGLLLPRDSALARVLRLPAYVCITAAAAALATLRASRGRQVDRWEHRRLPVTSPSGDGDLGGGAPR